jgi:hypothetical protein
MKRLRPLLAFAAIGLLACNREKQQRNKECGDWADWSNHAGDPIVQAVPDSEKAAATTNDAQAAVCRKLADGARKSAKASIPFSDPYVKELATRWLKVYDAVAVALDHQAAAWAAGDKDAEIKALREEMDAKAPMKALADEWMNKCQL